MEWGEVGWGGVCCGWMGFWHMKRKLGVCVCVCVCVSLYGCRHTAAVTLYVSGVYRSVSSPLLFSPLLPPLLFSSSPLLSSSLLFSPPPCFSPPLSSLLLLSPPLSSPPLLSSHPSLLLSIF